MIRVPGLVRLGSSLGVRAEETQSTRHVFADYLRGAMTRAGVLMSPELSLEISWVWSSVVLLSETVGTLPLIIYKRQADGGKVRATDHPLYRTLRTRPNPQHTAAEFWSLLQADVETRGNALAQRVSVRDKIELWPIPWKRVEAKDLGGGEALYLVDDGMGRKRELRRDQVMHFRGPLGNGLVAESPSERFRNLYALAWAIEAYIEFSFKNGARFSGVFKKAQGSLTDKAYANLKEWLATEYQGVVNSGRPLLLEEGLEFQSNSQTHDESKVVDLWDKVGAAIARVHRVPLHMLAAYIAQPRANMEQAAQEFISMSLRSRCTRVSDRVNCDLLEDGEEYFAEHLYEDLLRGDTAARYTAYMQAVGGPWMAADEARLRENLNPLGGEYGEVLKPLNMSGAAAGKADPEKT